MTMTVPRLCTLPLAFLALVSIDLQAQTRSSNTRTVWPDEGPMTWAPRATTTEITANDLRTRLYQFADDSMHGRRIGEPGNVKGTDYIAREFARSGWNATGEAAPWIE